MIEEQCHCTICNTTHEDCTRDDLDILRCEACELDYCPGCSVKVEQCENCGTLTCDDCGGIEDDLCVNCTESLEDEMCDNCGSEISDTFECKECGDIICDLCSAKGKCGVCHEED